MSKAATRTPPKPDIKSLGDHRRESGGGRNDRGDKSHGHSRSDSNSRKHADHQNDPHHGHDGDKNSEQKSTEEKKFTGRCRLFVGNLTPDVSEDDFRKMFEPYGEVSEVYVNTGRGFGFIRLDYRQNAEAAKAALDGLQRKGRVLRVRFATHGAALKVKNLHPFVSNELLEQAFTQFGELERAIVIVDDRGKPTGEGLVEFVRKPGAQQALRRINEGVFLFGSDPKPIEVEPLEQKDEEDGMPEKFLSKNEQYKKEREKDPHFAPQGSFEYEFGMRWKQLDDMEKKRIESVKKEMEEARIKLEDEMQNALYDYQAEQIRQDLLRQQEELRRIEELRNQDRLRRQQELEMRMSSRRAEEERARQQEERRREMLIRQQEMQRRSGGGPMEPAMQGRSREEMMQAGGMRGGPEGPGGFPGGPGGMGMRGGQGQGQGNVEAQMRGGRGGAPPMQPPPAPPAGMGLERGAQQGMGRMQQGGGGGQGGQGGFGGQGGLPVNAGGGAGNPSAGGSPNINNMGGMGGQGGPGVPGNQMDTDTWSNHYRDHRPQTSSAFRDDSPCSGPSQFEDAEEDTNYGVEHRYNQQDGCWLPPRREDQPNNFLNGGVASTKQTFATDNQGKDSDFRDWSSRKQNEFGDVDARSGRDQYVDAGDGSYVNAENSGWYAETEGEEFYGRTSVNDPYSESSGTEMSQGKLGENYVNGDPAYDDLSLTHETYNETVHDTTGEVSYGETDQPIGSSHDLSVSETNTTHNMSQDLSFSDTSTSHNVSHEMSFSEEQHQQSQSECEGVEAPDPSTAEVEAPQPEPDNSMALVPYLSPVRSPSAHSPCPSPPVSPPLRPEGCSVPPNMAGVATGVPLYPNPLSMGQPRLVRVHPMHVAAAVAAQQTRTAAAVMMQQRAAAAAVIQQQAARQQAAAAAAAVQQRAQQQATQQHPPHSTAQQQAAAVAAAVQQRSRAALMHQQLVRNRYMGAPVLVRPPFMPAARVATPLRVRMRVRRSMLVTEELSLGHP